MAANLKKTAPSPRKAENSSTTPRSLTTSTREIKDKEKDKIKEKEKTTSETNSQQTHTTVLKPGTVATRAATFAANRSISNDSATTPASGSSSAPKIPTAEKREKFSKGSATSTTNATKSTTTNTSSPLRQLRKPSNADTPPTSARSHAEFTRTNSNPTPAPEKKSPGENGSPSRPSTSSPSTIVTPKTAPSSRSGSMSSPTSTSPIPYRKASISSSANTIMLPAAVIHANITSTGTTTSTTAPVTTTTTTTTTSTTSSLTHSTSSISPKEDPIVFMEDSTIEFTSCGTFAFGNGNSGKLGIGSEKSSRTPVAITSLNSERICTAACSVNNTAFVTEQGKLYICGKNDSELYTLIPKMKGNQTIPQLINANFDAPIKKVSLGNHHILALTRAGTAYSWGANECGQLGHGNLNPLSEPKSINLSGVRDIATGPNFSVVISQFGELYCFGSNDCAQLGVGLHIPYNSTPEKMKYLRKVIQVVCGPGHALALTESNDEETQVWKWGKQVSGAAILPISTPTEIKALREKLVCQIATGNEHSIALTRTGHVYFWTGTMSGFTRVHSLTGHQIRQISSGEYHCAAVDDSGNIFTWGDFYEGQIGHTDVVAAVDPVKLAPFSKTFVRNVVCGPFHTVVITDDNPIILALHALTKNIRKYLIDINVLIYFFQKRIVLFDVDENKDENKSEGNKRQHYRDEVAPVLFNCIGSVESFVLRTLQNLDSLLDQHRIDPLTTILLPQLQQQKGKNEEFLIPRLIEALSQQMNDVTDLISYADEYSTAAAQLRQEVQTNPKFDELLIATAKEAAIVHGKGGKAVPNNMPTCPHIGKRDSGSMTNPNDLIRAHARLNSSPAIPNTGPAPDSVRLHARLARNHTSGKEGSQPKTLQQQKQDNEKKKDEAQAIARFSIAELLISPIKFLCSVVAALDDIRKQVTQLPPNFSRLYDFYAQFLNRISENFDLINPLDILSSKLNEFGSPVVAGCNMTYLVERLTTWKFIDTDFANAFFLTYRIYSTSEEFFKLLRERYSFKNAYSTGKSHQIIDFEKEKHLVQIRVVQVLHLWIKGYISSEDLNKKTPELVKGALEFLEDVSKDSKTGATELSDLKRVLNGKLNGEQKPAAPEAPDTGMLALQPQSQIELKPDVSLVDFDIQAVAEYLSYEDFQYFKNLHPREFLKQAWTKDNAEEIAPGIVAMTKRFNEITLWSILEVVSRKSTQERVNVVTYLVNLAFKLIELHNYSGMAAIAGGLSNSCITRLKKTFSKLSAKTQAKYKELTDVLTGVNNFKELRALCYKAEPPSIPVLAVTMKDLIFIDEVLPSQLETGQINFYKFRKISEMIFGLLEYQGLPYPAVVNRHFEHYLNVGIKGAVVYGEKGLYNFSKQREKKAEQ